MPRHVRPARKMQRAFLVCRTSVHLVSARPLNNQARYNDVDFTRLKANLSPVPGRDLFSIHGYSDGFGPVIAVFSYCFWNHGSETKANSYCTPCHTVVWGGGGEGEETFRRL